MLRQLAASLMLTAALLLVGWYAMAQEPKPATGAQPTFTRPAAAPGGYGLPATAAPVPVAYPPNNVRFMVSDYQGRIDEATQNRERELFRDTNALVEKYGQAKEAKEKADLEKELTRVVADHFALRQEIREKELLDLEEQLKRLRKVHDQRTAEKDRIVSDRVQQLLRESSGLGWGTDAHSLRTENSLWNSNQFSPNSVTIPRR